MGNPGSATKLDMFKRDHTQTVRQQAFNSTAFMFTDVFSLVMIIYDTFIMADITVKWKNGLKC